jgi:tripartite-type tricarboxylate transporter receptor subunit TctC
MTRRTVLATLAALPCVGIAQGAAWPTAKPLTYVVPFLSGGTTDAVGRILAAELQTALKQSVVVDNKPGQGGSIGAAFVANAPPDGYTLFGGTISTHAINPSMYRKLPYDPVRDFEPVALTVTAPIGLMVGSDLGVNSVSELIALLKRNEKKRTFASTGAGTTPHLAGQLLSDLTGLPLTHIAYKGSPPALVDVSTGEVSFTFDQLTAALPLIQAGKLKLLAVTTAKRVALFPSVPTMSEAGVAGFEMSSWQAVYVPKGTPKLIVDRLHSEIARALRMPSVQARLQGQLGLEIVNGDPQDLAALMSSEIPRWAELVRKSGARAD